MRIGVLGTGVVGRTIAVGLAGLGHSLMLGTREPATTLTRTEPDRMGTPPLSSWLTDRPDIVLGTFAEAAGHGELVVNATGGSASIDALTQAGAERLAGKVLLDVSNPLDFSRGFPPSLFVKDTDSLGEQIQRAFPDARVVKALNTMTAALMVDPHQLADGDHSTFISGNDAGAKEVVTSLLADLGHTDVIDLGDLTSARGQEMLLPIWLRLTSSLGTYIINFKIVR